MLIIGDLFYGHVNSAVSLIPLYIFKKQRRLYKIEDLSPPHTIYEKPKKKKNTNLTAVFVIANKNFITTNYFPYKSAVLKFDNSDKKMENHMSKYTFTRKL